MLILGTFMFVMFRADRAGQLERLAAPDVRHGANGRFETSYVIMSKFLPLWPDQASTMAGQVDALYIYLLLVSGLMTALIFIAVAVLAIKYRRVPGREAHPIEGSTFLEISWSVIPFFVMMTFFIWGAVIYFQERTPPADCDRSLRRR